MAAPRPFGTCFFEQYAQIALSENLFQDNADDLAFLESASDRQAIIDLHIRGIIQYINQFA